MRGLDDDVNEHIRRRATLITAERSIRFDTEVIKNATENEKRAVEIVNKIRMREAREVWQATGRTLAYPGMGFLSTKQAIMNTKLYQVMKELPKGGLLRVHLNTMCEAGFAYKLALEYPAMHVRVRSEIAAGTILPAPEFKPLTPHLTAAYAQGPALTSVDYVLGTWVPLKKARSEFLYGGPEAFDKWILGSMTLDAETGGTEYNTPIRAWQDVRMATRVAGGIIRYEPILRRYLRQTMLAWIEDGISYGEIRTNLSYKAYIWENGSETLSHRDYLVLFGEVVDEIKSEMKSEGREGDFIGAKIIYITFRFSDKEKLWWHLEDCMALKAEFPDLIAGFDFLGPEDIGKPLGHFLEPLTWFRQETKKRGLDIPFLFLVGETIEDGSIADINLYDALLLGSKRIGHGLNVVKHPLLMQMIKDQGVAIEVCPVANDILGLAPAVHHPLRTLLNNSIPIVLCSDNPGSFQNMSLSFDFFQVIAGSKSTNLLSLKQVAKYSIEYSSLNVEDKKRALKTWEEKWFAFVEKIVKENPEPSHLMSKV